MSLERSIRAEAIRAIRDESAQRSSIFIGLSNIDHSPEHRPEFRAVRQIESKTRNERRPSHGRRSSIVAANRIAQGYRNDINVSESLKCAIIG